ncbi:hypothetical protein [Microtetraspora sp. NBRC 16547]|uniref:hypothetical protein n=1 Tax=Microtetraspora sp. NBRC 16547 TaxID=3030993 RepID=UPI0024A2487B|nr:hypothetical protein [Microtetraspora sp. NBRC 16547]GLX02795.1 hypothetical protein Misp02_68810 [Microtetraspora sp. NBRC 16547]
MLVRLTEASHMLERVGWSADEAAALGGLALALRVAGRFEEAGAHLERDWTERPARSSPSCDLALL